MSRTIRRDRNGDKMSERNKKLHGRYRCKCNYCTSNERQRKREKIIDKEYLGI